MSVANGRKGTTHRDVAVLIASNENSSQRTRCARVPHFCPGQAGIGASQVNRAWVCAGRTPDLQFSGSRWQGVGRGSCEGRAFEVGPHGSEKRLGKVGWLSLHTYKSA